MSLPRTHPSLSEESLQPGKARLRDKLFKQLKGWKIHERTLAEYSERRGGLNYNAGVFLNDAGRSPPEMVNEDGVNDGRCPDEEEEHRSGGKIFPQTYAGLIRSQFLALYEIGNCIEIYDVTPSGTDVYWFLWARG